MDFHLESLESECSVQSVLNSLNSLNAFKHADPFPDQSDSLRLDVDVILSRTGGWNIWGHLDRNTPVWQVTALLFRLLTAAGRCWTTLPPSSSSLVLNGSKCSTAAPLWRDSSRQFFCCFYWSGCCHVSSAGPWPLWLNMSALSFTFPTGHQDFALCTTLGCTVPVLLALFLLCVPDEAFHFWC